MKNENTQRILLDNIKTILLNSTLNFSQSIYKNFNSSLSRNISLYCHLNLEDYNNLEMGLGLKTLEKISKNQEIITIPVFSGLNGLEMLDIKNDNNLKILKNIINDISALYAEKPTNISDNKFSKKSQLDNYKYQKMLQTQSLMWQVIVNGVNKESFNHDLVNSFPNEELSQIVFFNRQIIDNMSSISLKLLFSETLSAYKYIYDIINNQGIFEVSESLFLWSYNNVLSRKISVIDYNHTEEGSPIELIAPILEYVNHSTLNSNIIFEPDYDLDSKNSLIRVYASKDINPGEQLLMDYGRDELFNNRDLMNRFGFFDIDNVNKNIDIPFLMEDLFEIFEIKKEKIILKFTEMKNFEKDSNFKLELLKKENILNMSDKFTKLKIFDNKLDNELLKYLRILFLELEDFSYITKKEKCLNHNFNYLFSQENERKVFLFFKQIVENYYKFLKDKNYEKIIIDIGKIDNKEKFMMKNMYLLENEEKNLLGKNLNYLNKKLSNLI